MEGNLSFGYILIGVEYFGSFGLLSVSESNQMKFLEDICQGIVCPPKLRYSPYDLGNHPLIQAALSPPTEEDTISA